MTEPETKKQFNPVAPVALILGSMAGMGIGVYCGANLLIPWLSFCLLFAVLSKCPILSRHFVGAIATTGAHTTWIVAACILLGKWSIAWFDIAILGIGIVWLLTNPGYIAAAYLGVVQFVCLLVNVVMLCMVTLGSNDHRALTMHCLLRFIAIIFLAVGVFQLHRERSIPVAELDDEELDSDDESSVETLTSEP